MRRYVALNTLTKVVSMDTNAVQRHRNIILDCLRDGDISIRRRALELSYSLIMESTVRVLTRELLAFLEVDYRMPLYSIYLKLPSTLHSLGGG